MKENDLHYRQLSTILAALRMFQENPDESMEHFIDCQPLNNTEIEDLCEQLNIGYWGSSDPQAIIEVKSGMVQTVHVGQPMGVMVVDHDAISHRGAEFPADFDFPVAIEENIHKTAEDLEMRV